MSIQHKQTFNSVSHGVECDKALLVQVVQSSSGPNIQFISPGVPLLSPGCEAHVVLFSHVDLLLCGDLWSFALTFSSLHLHEAEMPLQSWCLWELPEKNKTDCNSYLMCCVMLDALHTRSHVYLLIDFFAPLILEYFKSNDTVLLSAVFCVCQLRLSDTL